MPTMITLVDNTIPVAADFNTNYTALNNAIGSSTGITTYVTGDTLYASAANTLSRLTIGATGQVLTATATIPEWRTPGEHNFNWTFNGDMEIWGAGSTAAPTGWTLSGAGGTIARNTTSGQFRYTVASAAVTRVGTDVVLFQDINLISGFGPIGVWVSRVVTFGCWVRATVASRARIQIDDGVGTTSSSYHTGGSTMEFLTVSRTINAAATRLRVQVSVDTGDTTAQFDGAILVTGTALSDFIPSGWRGRKAIFYFGTGTATVAAGTTAFLSADSVSTTEGEHQVIPPFANSVIRRLQVNSSAAPGAGETFVYTIRRANANSSVTATISNPNTTAADNTNESAHTPAQFLSLQVVTSALAAAALHRGVVEMEEVPV